MIPLEPSRADPPTPPIRRFEEAWTEHAGSKPDTRSDLIEKKEYIPGYA
jgi:hypothetical protein